MPWQVSGEDDIRPSISATSTRRWYKRQMSTRSIHFFALPDEFSAFVLESAEKHRLWVIRAGYGRNRLIEPAPDGNPVVMSDGAPAQWVFLSTEPPDLDTITPERLEPARWGWVDSDVPRTDGNDLYLAQLAAKTDWYDSETKQVYENPASAEIFRKVAPLLRRRLRRPV